MPNDVELRRALKRLVRHCERLTRGLSREAFATEAKANHGAGGHRFVSHAVMRDIIDAADAGRVALARHDVEPDQ